MLTFIAAHLGYVESPLAPAMAAMTKVRRPGGGPQTEIALAWIVAKREGREIFWHNGGTGGYRCFMGYDPKSRVGVVVLSNMSTTVGVDDIGMHLLDSSAPLAKLSPLTTHKEITLDPKIFDRYTGVYQFTPTITLTFTREGARMFTQLTSRNSRSSPKAKRVLPESSGCADHLRDWDRGPRHRRDPASKRPRSESRPDRAVTPRRLRPATMRPMTNPS
jgi:CubicO group peptidase (beta-lactamase class C family)